MLGITTRVGAAVAAVIFLAGIAPAAPVTFDVAGHAAIHTLIPSAATPGDQVAAAIAPSSLSVDIADDGSVALLGGTLHTQLSVALGNGGVLGTIATDELFTFPGGATGALSGDEITWSDVPIVGSLTGTFTCAGFICDLIGQPPGVILPLGLLPGGTLFLPETADLRFGTWILDPGHDQILGSSRLVLARADASSVDPPAGSPLRWAVLGDTDLGFQAPEPDAWVLLAAGFAALALAQRAAIAR